MSHCDFDLRGPMINDSLFLWAYWPFMCLCRNVYSGPLPMLKTSVAPFLRHISFPPAEPEVL